MTGNLEALVWSNYSRRRRRHRIQLQSLSFLPSDHGHCAESCRLKKAVYTYGSKDMPNQISHLSVTQVKIVSFHWVASSERRATGRNLSITPSPRSLKPKPKTQPAPRTGECFSSASFMSSLEVLNIVCICLGYYNPHHSEYVLQERAGVGSGGTRTAQTCEGKVQKCINKARSDRYISS